MLARNGPRPGCGTGTTDFDGRVVVGLDPVIEMLALSPVRDRVVGTGSRSLQEGSLDAVFSGFVFRNLSSVDDTLAEIDRVLKPGSTAVVVDLARPRNGVLRALHRIGSALLLPLVGLVFAGAPGVLVPPSLPGFLPPPETLFGPRPHRRAHLANGRIRLRVRVRLASTAVNPRRTTWMIVPPPSRPCGAGDGGRGLGSGRPASPGAAHLGLLPSGSDPVRGAPPRRTRPSTSRVHHRPASLGPSGGELSPAWRGFRVQGTPSAPPITIDIKGRRAPSITNTATPGRRALLPSIGCVHPLRPQFRQGLRGRPAPGDVVLPPGPFPGYLRRSGSRSRSLASSTPRPQWCHCFPPRPWADPRSDAPPDVLLVTGLLNAAVVLPGVHHRLGTTLWGLFLAQRVLQIALTTMLTYGADSIPAEHRTQGLALFGLSGLFP